MGDPFIHYQSSSHAYTNPKELKAKLLHRSKQLKELFKEGQEGALYDALVLCFAYGDSCEDEELVLAPKWALMASSYCLAYYLKHTQSKGANRWSKMIDVYLHFEEEVRRHDAVEFLIYKQNLSKLEAFELTGQELGLSPNTVKDSYYKISKIGDFRHKILEFFVELSELEIDESLSLSEIYLQKEEELHNKRQERSKKVNSDVEKSISIDELL